VLEEIYRRLCPKDYSDACWCDGAAPTSFLYHPFFFIITMEQRNFQSLDVSERAKVTNSNESNDAESIDNIGEEHVMKAKVEQITTNSGQPDFCFSRSSAAVDIVSASDTLSGVSAPETRLAEAQQSAAAAAIAARLRAEYMAPSRYTSSIFAAANGERWSVQGSIRALLRGSASGVALSSRGGPSPFIGRGAHVPRPPTASKSGSEAAFAKRRMSLVAPSSSSQMKATPRAASTTAAAEFSAPVASVLHELPGAATGGLLPPLPRKRP
jgi:hypothetical protein